MPSTMFEIIDANCCSWNQIIQVRVSWVSQSKDLKKVKFDSWPNPNASPLQEQDCEHNIRLPNRCI